MLSVYICYPTCPVIAMAHHLCLRHLVWPDFLASESKFILAFEEIGPFDCAQDRLCFGFVFLGRKAVHFHNPL